MKRELRFIPDSELRVVKQGDKRKIVGYATKFAPVQSADLGGFVEEIHPNAFDECLRAAPDVRGLWNHDANHVLGRTKSGTLRLSTDKTGLQYEIDPPNTNLARDLMESMDRGDVDQSSFGFYCIDDSWREGPNGTYIRTVLKAELFDVSPVTFPAYPDATSGTRGTRHVRALFPDGDDELVSKVAALRAAKEVRAEDAPGQKTKTVDGVALHHGNFAYVGDVTDPETWKLPINFPGDEEKTKSHIRNALARFSQTEGIPDSEKSKVWDKIVAAAKEHGIEVNEEQKSAATVGAETPEAAPAAVETAVTSIPEENSAAPHIDAAQSAPAARSEDGSCMGDDCNDGNTGDGDANDYDCECDCASCVLDDCENCANERCMDTDCRAMNCGMQTRAAAETELLQLRLKLHQHRAKAFNR